jgi:hypothetical protein
MVHLSLISDFGFGISDLLVVSFTYPTHPPGASLIKRNASRHLLATAGTDSGGHDKESVTLAGDYGSGGP